MKLFYLPLPACALIMLTGCPEQPIDTTQNTRQLNDICDKSHGCMPGLVCEDGLCRKVCGDTSDCPDDDYTCQDGRCVKNTTATPRKEGESCSAKQICAGGLECLDGICKKPCSGKNDCREGELCENGKCLPEPKRG